MSVSQSAVKLAVGATPHPRLCCGGQGYRSQAWDGLRRWALQVSQGGGEVGKECIRVAGCQ